MLTDVQKKALQIEAIENNIDDVNVPRVLLSLQLEFEDFFLGDEQQNNDGSFSAQILSGDYGNPNHEGYANCTAQQIQEASQFLESLYKK